MNPAAACWLSVAAGAAWTWSASRGPAWATSNRLALSSCQRRKQCCMCACDDRENGAASQCYNGIQVSYKLYVRHTAHAHSPNPRKSPRGRSCTAGTTNAFAQSTMSSRRLGETPASASLFCVSYKPRPIREPLLGPPTRRRPTCVPPIARTNGKPRPRLCAPPNGLQTQPQTLPHATAASATHHPHLGCHTAAREQLLTLAGRHSRSAQPCTEHQPHATGISLVHKM